MLARPDEIGAAHVTQCLAQDRPVVRVVIAQEGLMRETRFSGFLPL
jgi:hypothetical protein